MLYNREPLTGGIAFWQKREQEDKTGMKNFCVVIGSHQGIKERASIRCMYLLFTDSCQNRRNYPFQCN